MDLPFYECKECEEKERRTAVRLKGQATDFQTVVFISQVKGFVGFFGCFYLALELTKGAINLIVNKPYGNVTLNLKSSMY